MIVQNEKDLKGLKKIGRIVAQTLARMRRETQVGMTTAEVDEIGREFLAQKGALSAPQETYDFPGFTCISVNEEIAHGVPGKRVLQPGDVINIDVSAICDGYVADGGGTFVLPPVTKGKANLLQATWQALQEALKVARSGEFLSMVGKVVERVGRKKGYLTIRNLGSHGVGKKLHEEPSFIANYYNPLDKRKFKEGMVITLEPYLSTQTGLAVKGSNGWTLLGPRGNLSAQYEHTIVIGSENPIILTDHPEEKNLWFESKKSKEDK